MTIDCERTIPPHPWTVCVISVTMVGRRRGPVQSDWLILSSTLWPSPARCPHRAFPQSFTITIGVTIKSKSVSVICERRALPNKRESITAPIPTLAILTIDFLVMLDYVPFFFCENNKGEIIKRRRSVDCMPLPQLKASRDILQSIFWSVKCLSENSPRIKNDVALLS